MGKLLLHKIVSGVWFGLLGTLKTNNNNNITAFVCSLLEHYLENFWRKPSKLRTFVFFCVAWIPGVDRQVLVCCHHMWLCAFSSIVRFHSWLIRDGCLFFFFFFFFPLLGQPSQLNSEKNNPFSKICGEKKHNLVLDSEAGKKVLFEGFLQKCRIEENR